MGCPEMSQNMSQNVPKWPYVTRTYRVWLVDLVRSGLGTKGVASGLNPGDFCFPDIHKHPKMSQTSQNVNLESCALRHSLINFLHTYHDVSFINYCALAAPFSIIVHHGESKVIDTLVWSHLKHLSDLGLSHSLHSCG